ncbi:MAG: pyridoxine 5'-phosphate synthase [Deltaproteobacteria bacterium]|nr:pyridoxine 5'-phosphate synthase [Deltaproteobacteria bacterium]
MVRLSVNVNKVATLRNSRGGRLPSVLEAVRTCLDAGVPGITVHPRADERHITSTDVREVAALLAEHRRATGADVEYNIEGDPKPAFLELVHEVRPDQVTLVPVREGEVTSQAGWPTDTRIEPTVNALRDAGMRVSLFVDPAPEPIQWAADMGGDRVELFTEPYARAHEEGATEGERSYALYAAMAKRAHALGLGVNAGHDLDLENLVRFRSLPHLDEVSIGHALMSRALFVGLESVVREYLAILAVS